ncbi:CDP-diacylglycerol diphosphatase [Salmonella enterica subsp. enterica serovar Weltevreden]|nr:CDP-diacylglycerol diphosphatase [Salmonella enterica subsp. enterica serovar Weltevreden]
MTGNRAEQCLPDQLQHQTQRRARKSNLAPAMSSFKDRHGPLQYLLMPHLPYQRYRKPTIAGTRYAQLFSGWPGRPAAIRSKKYGHDIPDSAVSLAITRGLVVHRTIAYPYFCIRPDVREQLITIHAHQHR